MKRLLLGTTNKAKIEEYKKLLSDLPMELVSLTDLSIAEKPEEKGKTFEENAIIKAKFYFEKSGIPTLVDDGGLEIEALGGEPGVHSRRWLGREMTDEELVKEVMKRMEGQSNRGCRLNLVIALATPFGIMTSDAALEGIIAENTQDKKIEGFPYASVMFFPNYNKHYCDLSDQEHEILNHRKHALDKIKDMFVEISK
jgi:XTP/dITP diphosphohydrolase